MIVPNTTHCAKEEEKPSSRRKFFLGTLAGVFFPWDKGSLPLELKQDLFAMLTGEIARQIARRGLSEKQVLADFERWRKARRAARRRR